MNEFDIKKILLKNLWWLGLILIAAILLRIDFNFNSAFPLENGTMLKGNLVLNSEGENVVHDNYSLPLFTIVFSIGGLIFSRITSFILSLFMLFFFYKFVDRMFKDKLASIFSVIFLAIMAPIIFLGRFVSVDILSLTFFSAFLMVSAEIMTVDDKSKKVPIVNISKQVFCPLAASVLFVLSAFSNYIVLLFFIPALIFFFIKDKKVFLLFTISSIGLILILYLLNSDLINYHLSSISDINNENFKISKILIRMAEYMAIPLMLTFALQQIIWKTDLRNSLIFSFIGMSLLIPVYIILSDDVYNIYRLIPFSLILLTPFCGFIISKFILINPSYKYATIFAMFFIVVVSYWHLSKLELSYPNTYTIINYCKDKFEKNNVVYCEDPYLLSNNFYPSLDIDNFKSVYYLNSKYKSFDERKKNIINQIDNGMVDYVVLNGLFHPELTSYLKDKILRQKFTRIMSQEFTINSLLFPMREEEGYFDIYKIDPEYKYLGRFMASR